MKDTTRLISQLESSTKRGSGRRFDLKGERFENLLVINLHSRKNHNRVWECLCDCGKTCFSPTRYLNYGSARSCGCLKGTGMQKPLGIAAFNKLFGRYKRFAKKRKIDFLLSSNEFRELTSQNCHYCLSPPCQNMGLFFKKTGDYIHNGIDRVDSNKPYESSNVVPCCGICNRAKHSLKYDKFMEWIERIRSTPPTSTSAINQSTSRLG